MKTVISIVLILVGIVGIYIIYSSSTPQAPVIIQEPPQQQTEQISVAVAKRDLAGKTLLTDDDFSIKVITVPLQSSEKAQFSVGGLGSLANWALTAPIEEGSNIPVSLLLRPGSTEYIAMFLQPGSVIYSFTIAPADYYIFDNLKVGEYVDIYLAYDRNPISGDVNSPGNRPTITDMRLKPIMTNKRVLSITPSLAATKKKQIEVNQNIIDGDDRVVVELTDYDLKALKTLEGKAKFIIFPSVPPEVLEKRINAKKVQQENPDAVVDSTNNVLSEKELESWPISNEELFAGTTKVKRIQG